MKLLSKDETDAHYRATLQGGILGGLAGLSAGALGVYLASRRYQGFRNITLAWRGYFITSAGTFGAVKAADYSSHRYEATTNHPDYEYHQKMNELRNQLHGQEPISQRLSAWASKNQYSIVFGSWVACLGTAWHMLGRNPYLTRSQKLVQARVFAQGLTVAMAVVALALQKHGEDRALEQNEDLRRISMQPQEQWRDMVEAQADELEREGVNQHGVPVPYRRSRETAPDHRDMRRKAIDQLGRWQMQRTLEV